MKFRKFRLGDEAAVCKVLRSSIEHTFRKDYPKCGEEALHEWLDNKTPENILKWMEFPDNGNVVIDFEGEIIGVGLVNLKTGYLSLCYLLPKFIGKGLGKKLFQEIEKMSKTADVKKLNFTSTPSAEIFYEKCGAIRIGEEFNVTDEVENPIMEKAL